MRSTQVLLLFFILTFILVWILAAQISAAKFSLLHTLNFFALEYSGVVFLAEAFYPVSRFRLRPLMEEVKWWLLPFYR